MKKAIDNATILQPPYYNSQMLLILTIKPKSDKYMITAEECQPTNHSIITTVG